MFWCFFVKDYFTASVLHPAYALRNATCKSLDMSLSRAGRRSTSGSSEGRATVSEFQAFLKILFLLPPPKKNKIFDS